MHIQEVIIDGFKSYAHKTVVEGFDPHFNAITGLNGSGKSNILDAICFVLGISNLSQVRAGSLTELVYKQGQAGVNKASVTIVFNNKDKATSPVGYDQCDEVTVTRQVLVGGKSKYIINARSVTANQVTNLFHSVQLNVNNPHFLIMQGRITKVLNMKPNEILGMVEEAAGTRMYETKRLAAIKTMEKKQAKVDEINSILSDEITPTLERLRGEKQSYLKWSKNNSDIERLDRFVVASEFARAKLALDNNSEGTSEMERKIDELEEKHVDYKNRITQKEQQIKELSTRLNGELFEEQDRIKKLEEKRSKELVKITSTWQNSKAIVKAAGTELEAARTLLNEAKTALSSKEHEISGESKMLGERKQAAEDAGRELARLTSDYQNMAAGISSSQGDEALTLPDQISKAHSDSKNAEAKSNQAQMKINHLEKEIKNVEKDMRKEERSSRNLAAKKEKAQTNVDAIQKQLQDLGFMESEFNALDQEKNELETSITELTDLVERLSVQLEGRLSFRYSDPVHGFDRSKVKGIVAKLTHVKNSNHSTALEVVAGGKLYQVVVDEAITGKALLSRGKLQRRVTIIPLDKIQPRRVTNAVCDQAHRIATTLNTTSSPAIELVGFDEEVRSAMEYVFGSTLVVDGAKAANQICDATKTRTVTLDGDVYDPAGTISGGSRNQLGSTLSQLAQLTEASEELGAKKERLQAVLQMFAPMQAKSKQFDKMNARLEISKAELAGVQKHLSQTSYGMLAERFESMSVELEAARKECVEMDKEKQVKMELYRELKDREKELTAQREHRLKDFEKAIQDAKKKAAELEKNAREEESKSQTLVLELDSLKTEHQNAEQAVVVAEKSLKEANDSESEIQIKVGEVKAQYDEAKADLDDMEERLALCSAERTDLNNEKASLVKEAESVAVEKKRLSVAIARAQKERASAERLVSTLLQKHPWIESEKSAFGVPGGDYDFQATDPHEMSRLVKELRDEQNMLNKKINKKVMGMIEKVESEYKELMRKRKVIENDKKKIQAVIEELDVKKKTELERTWIKVNRDFGSIFSTLLPGASAKLEPPEGMQAWEGLEVKVAFGEVWKESLSELSGGQRSLLALSLILSLLLFKPAPMYILDEVDAALDLSHTQNIGNMLKTHFAQSQFVVVSLKEGMFNNANVIFRTKFVDGVSTVTRTIGAGASVRARSQNTSTDVSNTPFSKRNRNSSATRRATGKENAV